MTDCVHHWVLGPGNSAWGYCINCEADRFHDGNADFVEGEFVPGATRRTREEKKASQRRGAKAGVAATRAKKASE